MMCLIQFNRVILVTILFLFPSLRVFAQENVGWNIYYNDYDPNCWLVSLPDPMKSKNYKDGLLKSVRRGSEDDGVITALYVVAKKGGGPNSLYLAFTGGSYGFSEKKEDQNSFQIKIDNFEKIPLFIENVLDTDTKKTRSWAFSYPKDDQIVIDAMKRGSAATVTSVSKRGTFSEDYFSLVGFSAALTDVVARCK